MMSQIHLKINTYTEIMSSQVSKALISNQVDSTHHRTAGAKIRKELEMHD